MLKQNIANGAMWIVCITHDKKLEILYNANAKIK